MTPAFLKTAFWRRFVSPAARAPWKRATVCSVGKDKTYCLHIKREADGRYEVVPDAPKIRDEFAKDATAIVVGILPKRLYLTRTLTIPDADPDQVRAMLSLEAASPLQPDFGPAETAYRKLRDADVGQSVYEVYVARVSDVEEAMRTLERDGIRPTMLVPVLWRELFKSNADRFDMCVAATQDGVCEAAVALGDGDVAVRGLSDGVASSAETRFLQECVRAVKSSQADRDRGVHVGLIGSRSAFDTAQLGNDVKASDVVEPDVVDSTGPVDPLALAGAVALTTVDPDDLETADMTPRCVVFARRQAAMNKRLLRTLGMIFASLAVLLAAGKIAVARYDRYCARLDSQITNIRTIGESVEQKRLQLKAVRQAQATRNRLHDVIAGLHAATPKDVSYNQVDLANDLTLRMRGQASSASLPFLLPERMENSGVFGQVVLRGVGQKSRGAGSVTQFELECRLLGGLAK